MRGNIFDGTIFNGRSNPFLCASLYPIAQNVNVTAGTLADILNREASWSSTLLEATGVTPTLNYPALYFFLQESEIKFIFNTVI